VHWRASFTKRWLQTGLGAAWKGMTMAEKTRDLIGSDGSRMGRDENGSYMIGADGSCMRKGPAGSVMVSADGTTLRKTPRSGKG
jgi:hypothetical protein